MKTRAATGEKAREPDEQGVLEPAKESLSGFRNLVGKENGEWTTGPSLVANLAIWILIVALVSVAVAFVRDEVLPNQSPRDLNDAGALMFFVLGSVASVIAVVAKMQGTIIGEKQLGTAAWVLSKPASRRAFVLAKLVVHFRWLLTVTLILPAVVFYVLMTTVSQAPTTAAGLSRRGRDPCPGASFLPLAVVAARHRLRESRGSGRVRLRVYGRRVHDRQLRALAHGGLPVALFPVRIQPGKASRSSPPRPDLHPHNRPLERLIHLSSPAPLQTRRTLTPWRCARYSAAGCPR